MLKTQVSIMRATIHFFVIFLTFAKFLTLLVEAADDLSDKENSLKLLIQISHKLKAADLLFNEVKKDPDFTAVLTSAGNSLNPLEEDTERHESSFKYRLISYVDYYLFFIEKNRDKLRELADRYAIWSAGTPFPKEGDFPCIRQFKQYLDEKEEDAYSKKKLTDSTIIGFQDKFKFELALVSSIHIAKIHLTKEKTFYDKLFTEIKSGKLRTTLDKYKKWNPRVLDIIENLYGKFDNVYKAFKGY